MLTFFLQKLSLPTEANLPGLLRDWREDAINFLRHDAPKIVFVLVIAYVLIRILRMIASKTADLHIRKLPSGLRVQQIGTLTSVMTSVGVFVILFIAILEVLSLLGLNLGPMLARAGIAGLAIGYGGQTLLHHVSKGLY